MSKIEKKSKTRSDAGKKRFIDMSPINPQSEPAKPKQVVCSECSGFGSITIAGCTGTKVEKCPLCERRG